MWISLNFLNKNKLQNYQCKYYWSLENKEKYDLSQCFLKKSGKYNNVTYFYYGISILLLYETFPLSMIFSTVQLTLLNIPQVRANWPLFT